ncbi:MAG: CCA tRNA nucleotidyltransferase [Rhodobacteraceae bacterium]|nr:CCA tRNA nucleotidyltransferase [Paracoccaceae bacterium]
MAAAGHEIYFVGGCVRNALLGQPVSDIDLATNAAPKETLAAAQAAGLRAVPTGIDHGTVTLVADGHPFEVTTFRRDVETDGRRAVVVFSERLEDDAARRDFTMNALYATPDGTVIDPVGGLADLAAGRLRFIGDADGRIAEDYLRILRFFRFHAWYADPANGMDGEALAACARGADGLGRLSAERVGHEMRKLLAAPDPAPSVAAMARTGILARVLPGADPAMLAPLVDLEDRFDVAADPIRRLAALGGEDPAARLRLSRAEARRLSQLRAALGSDETPAALGYRYGPDTAMDIALLRAALSGQPLAADTTAEISRGARSPCPVGAVDLMPGLAGAALGDALARIEGRWIRSDFRASRDELLHKL